MEEDSISFLYGSCIPPKSGDGGCPAPYQVIIQSACTLPPGFAAREEVEAEKTVREAPAEIFRDGHLTLWTQNIAITIFAPTGDDTLSLANDIVPMNSSAQMSDGGFTPATQIDALKCGPDSPAAEVASRAE